MRVRRRCSAGAAVLPVASAPLRSDRASVLSGFAGDAANFVTRAPAPTSSFILALRDRGPHAIGLAVRPRSGRVTDSGSVVGPIRGRDQTNNPYQGCVVFP
jgi:hypothetical protein